MPKLLSGDSCATCRRRKIKCDGQCPVCHNCIKAKRDCLRTGRELKFVIHSSGPIRESKTHSPSIPEQALPKQNSQLQTEQESVEYKKAEAIASLSPKSSLAKLEISILFNHYITHLAPWYDLLDFTQTFGNLVPERALKSAVLFKALIAFSASHLSKISGEMQGLGPAFHSACVRELLETMHTTGISNRGDYLAATCLLRSYEILEGDSRKQQNHLLGAYSLSINTTINLNDHGLLQAGAWNYLREEITVALECRRQVRISENFSYPRPLTDDHKEDDVLANWMSFLLAMTINFSFSSNDHSEERIRIWDQLKADLRQWNEGLPDSFTPYSTAPKVGNPFPSLWMLRPWHVAAQQYNSVAEILLAQSNPLSSAIVDLDFMQNHALKICGLAFTNESISARVNAFGPMAFCGRYLVKDVHRRGLEIALIEFRKGTMWPVDCIIEDLRECWAAK